MEEKKSKYRAPCDEIYFLLFYQWKKPNDIVFLLLEDIQIAQKIIFVLTLLS
jgi:hypothetical protein